MVLLLLLPSLYVWSCFIGGGYRTYNLCGLPNTTVKDVSEFIIDQYVEADKRSVGTAQIHVPVFNSDDNFPLATYGNHCIANALHKYGVTQRNVVSEFVPDHSVNERFGIK